MWRDKHTHQPAALRGLRAAHKFAFYLCLKLWFAIRLNEYHTRRSKSKLSSSLAFLRNLGQWTSGEPERIASIVTITRKWEWLTEFEENLDTTRR